MHATAVRAAAVAVVACVIAAGCVAPEAGPAPQPAPAPAETPRAAAPRAFALVEPAPFAVDVTTPTLFAWSPWRDGATYSVVLVDAATGRLTPAPECTATAATQCVVAGLRDDAVFTWSVVAERGRAAAASAPRVFATIGAFADLATAAFATGTVVAHAPFLPATPTFVPVGSTVTWPAYPDVGAPVTYRVVAIDGATTATWCTTVAPRCTVPTPAANDGVFLQLLVQTGDRVVATSALAPVTVKQVDARVTPVAPNAGVPVDPAAVTLRWWHDARDTIVDAEARVARADGSRVPCAALTWNATHGACTVTDLAPGERHAWHVTVSTAAGHAHASPAWDFTTAPDLPGVLFAGVPELAAPYRVPVTFTVHDLAPRVQEARATDALGRAGASDVATRAPAAPLPPSDAPIVLVHGWTSSPTAWRDVEPRLEDRDVITVAFKPRSAAEGVPELAVDVRDQIDRAFAARGLAHDAPFHVVGHSMGGLVARTLAAGVPGGTRDAFTSWTPPTPDRAFAVRVASVTVIGAPNAGTIPAVGCLGDAAATTPWLGQACADMVPGSSFLTRLAAFGEPVARSAVIASAGASGCAGYACAVAADDGLVGLASAAAAPGVLHVTASCHTRAVVLLRFCSGPTQLADDEVFAILNATVS